MVNLRQSISTFRKKGGVSSPTTKFRKSAGSPTASASKRMSTLGMFKNKTDENDTSEFDTIDDLASHIGEIKVSSPALAKLPYHPRSNSFQDFQVEEQEEEKELDPARKTDLKLQERREQRRKRQEELQKQLQLKLQNSTDSSNPSLADSNDFPSSLPLDTDSEEPKVKPRVSGGRKSAVIRSRRVGESANRESRVSGQRNSSQSSPGRRMSRRPKPLDGTEHQSDGSSPLIPIQKELGEENGTIHELGEDEKMPGRTARERRKGRRKEDAEESQEFEGSPSPLGDIKRLDGQQAVQRRERRKSEMPSAQRKPGENSQSPGALSSSYRSSAGKQTENGGRQRQSMYPRVTSDVSPFPDMDSSRSGRASGLDTSSRSTGQTSGLDASARPTGWKSKVSKVNLPQFRGSWDDGVDQRGLSIQSEHRTTATRRKRREKMDEQKNHLLHRSDHGDTGISSAKRQTISGGSSRKRDVHSQSPQSDQQRKQRESDTMRTNRSLDDDMILASLQKSNGVRFDVKDDPQKRTTNTSAGHRGRSPSTPGGKPKIRIDGNMVQSPMESAVKKASPKRMPFKSQKRENPKGSTLPPVWDDEYGAEATKAQVETSSLNDISKPNMMESLEDASESQHDFEYQEPSRNRIPDVQSGEEWLEPVAVESESDVNRLEALIAKADQIEEVLQYTGDAVGYVAKAKLRKKPRKSKNLNAEDKQDAIVYENSSSSSGAYTSSSSTATPEIPAEVPVAQEDLVNFSNRVSVLNPHGISSDEESGECTSASSGDSGDNSDSSEENESSNESVEAAVIPGVVSFESSLDKLGDISSPSSASENGGKQKGEGKKTRRFGKPMVIGPLDDPILPSSLRASRTTAPIDVIEDPNGKEEDIPPPPPPPPEPADSGKPKHAHLMPDEVSEDGTFDDIFSNEITALEGTLQSMGDLLLTPMPPRGTKKTEGSPDVPPAVTTNIPGYDTAPKEYDQSKLEAAPLQPLAIDQKAPSKPLASVKDKSNDNLQVQSGGNQFLMDMLSLITSPSMEQKKLMENNPTARNNIMIAAAKQENQNRQQLIQKVEWLESKLSSVQKDLESQKLETAAHKMQVATQDLTISDYKDAMESLTRKCQSLEKETEAITLKYREQEEKGFQLKESLDEINKLLKEQQMFMNVQQRQMQTMESKISSLRESRDHEASKMIVQNEKLREIIHIQKETILKALGKQGEPDA